MFLNRIFFLFHLQCSLCNFSESMFLSGRNIFVQEGQDTSFACFAQQFCALSFQFVL